MGGRPNALRDKGMEARIFEDKGKDGGHEDVARKGGGLDYSNDWG